MNSRPANEKTLLVISVLVPFVIFAFNTLPLDNWIIDDAGISFAYARNLAFGHGLVSQPGMPPVEGYSNPLWVYLLVPFFWLKLFDPVITPKLLGLALVLIGFFGIASIFRKLTQHPALPTAVALTLLAFNAPMLIWTSSGLENALTFALGMWFLGCCMTISRGQVSTSVHLIAGLIVASVALTRPEGIVYLLLYIAATLLGKKQEDRWSSTIRQLSAGLGVVLLLVGGHQIFRMLYFGDILPNPAYVKGTPGANELIGVMTFSEPYLLKYRNLCASIFGQNFWLISDVGIVVSFVTFTVLALLGRISRVLMLPFFMVILSCGLFLVMTPDWMREFRFATLYYPSIVISLVVTITLVLRRIKWMPIKVLCAAFLILVALYMTRNDRNTRLKEFAASPTVPMSRVYDDYVAKFSRIVAHLQLDSVSQLLPDLGSTLYYSPYKTYDLAGLTDRSIAKNRGINHEQFYRYVFDTIRPTIIHTHGFFSSVSRLERDPRFLRDYIAIRDSLEPYWNDSVLAGDYLRRDALIGKDSLFSQLQRGERPWDNVSKR